MRRIDNGCALAARARMHDAARPSNRRCSCQGKERRRVSGTNEATAHARGVRRIGIPNRSTKSAERKRDQKKRWFRNGQKWRTGCEGRISVVKRRHGLTRCRYKGADGMKRWVGLGVVADTLINIGRVLAARP